jgi:hypothetical protein
MNDASLAAIVRRSNNIYNEELRARRTVRTANDVRRWLRSGAPLAQPQHQARHRSEMGVSLFVLCNVPRVAKAIYLTSRIYCSSSPAYQFEESERVGLKNIGVSYKYSHARNHCSSSKKRGTDHHRNDGSFTCLMHTSVFEPDTLSCLFLR